MINNHNKQTEKPKFISKNVSVTSKQMVPEQAIIVSVLLNIHVAYQWAIVPVTTNQWYQMSNGVSDKLLIVSVWFKLPVTFRQLTSGYSHQSLVNNRANQHQLLVSVTSHQ